MRLRKSGPNSDRATQLILCFAVAPELGERNPETVACRGTARIEVHEVLVTLQRLHRSPASQMLGALGQQELRIARAGASSRCRRGLAGRSGTPIRGEPQDQRLGQLVDDPLLDSLLEQTTLEGVGEL